jgi:hypothetical protein
VLPEKGVRGTLIDAGFKAPEGRTEQPRAARFQLGATTGHRKQFLVERRKNPVDALAAADFDERVEVSRRQD